MLIKTSIPQMNVLSEQLTQLTKQLPKKASLEYYDSPEVSTFSFFRDHLPDLSPYLLAVDKIDVEDMIPRLGIVDDLHVPIIESSETLRNYMSVTFEKGQMKGLQVAQRIVGGKYSLGVSVDQDINSEDRPNYFEQAFSLLGLKSVVIDRSSSLGFKIISNYYAMRVMDGGDDGIDPLSVSFSDISDFFVRLAPMKEEVGMVKRSVAVTKAVYQSATRSQRIKNDYSVSVFGKFPASASMSPKPCAAYYWKDNRFVQVEADTVAQQLIPYSNFTL